ncbi:WD repeat-containing protein 34-like [Actinia tenebrosa]|uniref:WD repeat-containing protein 34-like n=1 Tax=Actinia tenebrosa TaxID=6105 RepID=A0A6P8HI01_ACTTE|nr:WD repeat-containing protein 34-like [Actinia tenebrosa]
MFSVESQEGVYFQSSWKTERSVKDSVAQTSEIITYEADVQVIQKLDAEVQTEEEKEPQLTIGHDISQNLINFMLNVYPDVSKQLDANTRSHAFDGYDVDWEEKSSSVSCEYQLINSDQEEQLQVTGLSWNSTGSVIAASYGRLDHEDWCTHKSSLCTWNLDRKTLNANKPDTTVDLSSCLMTISFHPVLPALVAGGTFNGEVLLWDLSKEDDMLIGSSGMGSDSHREPVTKVLWIIDPDSKGKKYQILSASGDGKVLLWQAPSQGSQDLKLVGGYLLQTGAMPRSMRVSKAKGDAEMGVTTVSFSHEDKTLFVMGSEAGGIFKCSINSRGPPLSTTSSSVALKSPVTFAFAPHFGPVFSVECSPFHRNLFVTCGTDGSIRIYTMLQSKPLLSLEPGAGYLFKVCWSPVRPLVFSVVTADGRLLIYDLKTNHINPVTTIEASQNKKPVYSMEFNRQRLQLIATGDSEGVIKIWRLNDDLTTQRSQELDILNDLANTQAE